MYRFRAIMTANITTKEWEAEIGIQLRQLRIRQSLDQRQLAAMAGVALNAVKNLEAGKGAALTSFVKVLRALGRVEWVKTLAPAVSISPLQMIDAKHPRRRAARKSKPYHV